MIVAVYWLPLDNVVEREEKLVYPEQVDVLFSVFNWTEDIYVFSLATVQPAVELAAQGPDAATTVI